MTGEWLLKHPRFRLHFTPTSSEWNKDPRPFIWTKTADEILETLAATL